MQALIVPTSQLANLEVIYPKATKIVNNPIHVYTSSSTKKSYKGSKDTSSMASSSTTGSKSSTSTTTVEETRPVWEDQEAMNNILTKPGMFDKALHQFLDTGAINNSDFHLQNLAFRYRGPEEFAGKISHPLPTSSNVVVPKSYKLDNPVTIHQTHDRKVSGTSNTSTTSSGSQSRTGSRQSTTTTTVTEPQYPHALKQQLDVFEERTQGLGVDYSVLENDRELIQQIYEMGEQSGEPVADYWEDLQEVPAKKRLALMLI